MKEMHKLMAGRIPSFVGNVGANEVLRKVRLHHLRQLRRQHRHQGLEGLSRRPDTHAPGNQKVRWPLSEPCS